MPSGEAFSGLPVTLVTQTGHALPIVQMQLRKGGRQLVTMGSDGGTVLWDFTSTRQIRTGDGVEVYSPDGVWYAKPALYQNKESGTIDFAAEVHAASAPAEQLGSRVDPVHSAFDWRTDAVKQSRRSLFDQFSRLTAISPDSRYLLVADPKGGVVCWDLRANREVTRALSGLSKVSYVAIANQHVAVAGEAGVQILHLPSLVPVGLPLPYGGVQAVRLTPDGAKLLLIQSHDQAKRVVLLERSTGKESCEVRHEDKISFVSPQRADGRVVLLGDEYPIAVVAEEKFHKVEISADATIGLPQDGKWFVLVDNGTVTTVSADCSRKVSWTTDGMLIQRALPVLALPDGEILVAASGKAVLADVWTGELRRIFRSEAIPVGNVVIHPDGGNIGVVLEKGRILHNSYEKQIWSTKSRQVRRLASPGNHFTPGWFAGTTVSFSYGREELLFSQNGGDFGDRGRPEAFAAFGRPSEGCDKSELVAPGMTTCVTGISNEFRTPVMARLSVHYPATGVDVPLNRSLAFDRREISYSNNGLLIAAPTLDRRIAWWRLPESEPSRVFEAARVRLLSNFGGTLSLDMRNDRHTLELVGDERVTSQFILDLLQPEEIRAHGEEGLRLTVGVEKRADKDGKPEENFWLKVTGPAGTVVDEKVHMEQAFKAAGFSPDDRLLAINFESSSRLLDQAVVVEVESGKVLRTFEKSQFIAFIDNARFLVLDDQKLAATDLTGKEYFKVTAEGHDLRAIRVSRDGKLLVLAWGDGFVSLLDARDGHRIGRLYAFEGGHWAVIDAAGRFDASNPELIRGMHWVVDDDPVELDQLNFKLQFPGLLASLLGGQPLPPVQDLQLKGRAPAVSHRIVKNKLELTLDDQGGGMGEVAVSVNNRQFWLRDLDRAPASGSRARNKVHVELPAFPAGRRNYIQVVTSPQGNAYAARPEIIRWTEGVSARIAQKVWIVSIGVGSYQGTAVQKLFSPSNDSADLAYSLALGAEGLVGGPQNLRIFLLNESGAERMREFAPQTEHRRPTRDNIEAVFTKGLQTGPDDVLIVYLTGHGRTMPGPRQLYLFPTADAVDLDFVSDLERSRRAISSFDLAEWLKKMPADKQVLVVDTCESGGLASAWASKASSVDQEKAMRLLRTRAGVHILTSSAVGRNSFERLDLGRSVLAEALLRGMRGDAFRDGDQLDLQDWFEKAIDTAEALSASAGTEPQRGQYIKPKGGQSFPIALLSVRQRAEIPGTQQLRTILVRPVVLNLDAPEDRSLATALQQALRKKEPDGVLLIDSPEHPDGWALNGFYKNGGAGTSFQGVLAHLSRGKKSFNVRLNNDDSKETWADAIIDTILRTLVEEVVNK
jgi:hypothetical protein